MNKFGQNYFSQNSSDNDSENINDISTKKPSGKNFSMLFLAAVCFLFMTLGGVWNTLPAFSDEGSATISLGATVLSFVLMIIAVGIGGFILCLKPVIYPALPLLSFGAVLAVCAASRVTLDASLIVSALWVLIPVAGSVGLYLAYRLKLRRTSAIILTASFCGVVNVILFLANFYLVAGTISLSVIFEEINGFRDLLIAEAQKQLSSMDAEVSGLLSAEAIEASFNAAFNILPSIFISIFSITGFFAHKTFLRLFRMNMMLGSLGEEMKRFEITKITAIIYLATYLLIILSAGHDSVFVTVLNNLYTILELPLALVGIMSISPRVVGNTMRVGCMPISLVIVAFLFSPPLALLLLSFFGAVSTLKRKAQ